MWWLSGAAQAALPLVSPNSTSSPAAPGGDPLASLRDIHLPPPVSHWPLAPGWWCLAAAVVVIIIALAVWLWWRHRRRVWRRAASELAAVTRAHLAADDPRPLLLALNDLLRRVARRHPQHAAMASASSEAWQQFLMQGRGAIQAPEATLLALAPYWPPAQLAAQPLDRAALVAAVRCWLKENG